MADKSRLEQRVIRHSPSTGANSPDVWGIYEPATGSIQYICADPVSKRAALIDIVLDFDPTSFKTDTGSMDQVLELVSEQGLIVTWILDTHPHADHVLASAELKKRTGAPNAIGEKIIDIANLWRDIYNLPDAFDPANDFDHLLADGDTLKLGELELRVMFSPGHTLGSVTYVCGDAAFVNDTLMYPDSGTARSDFPGGSTEDLWNSLQAILDLPESTRLFIGHDYGSDDREEPQWEASVKDHKTHNKHVRNGIGKTEFIKKRKERDATLSLPDRMLAAIQINLRAGQLPAPESDGASYLKIPVNKF